MPHDGWHPHDHDDHGMASSRTIDRAARRSSWLRRPSCRSAAPARRPSMPPQRIADAANRFLGLPRRRPAPAGADRLRVRQPARLALHPAQPRGPHPGRDDSRRRPTAARALFATVLNEQRPRSCSTACACVEGVLREQQGSFRDPDRYYVLDLRHARPLPVGLALRGPSPVAERRPGRLPATSRRRRSSSAPIPPRCATARTRASAARRRRGSRAPDSWRSLAERAAAHRASSPTARSARSSPARSASATSASRAGLSCRRHGRHRRATCVEALIDRFLGTLAPDLAAAQKRRVMEQELGNASASPGRARSRRARRITSACTDRSTLIEHDNTQNSANHIHSVWRDLAADFGHDALAEHYRQQPHRARPRGRTSRTPASDRKRRCRGRSTQLFTLGTRSCGVTNDMIDAALVGKRIDRLRRCRAAVAQASARSRTPRADIPDAPGVKLKSPATMAEAGTAGAGSVPHETVGRRRRPRCRTARAAGA